MSSNNKQSLLDFFFSSRKYTTVKLPYYDYLRGQVFIEDVKDNYPEEIEYSFDIGHLIIMLYLDFLKQIKKGVKNEDVANYIKQSINKYFEEETIERRVFKQVNNTFFQYEDVEEIKESEEDREKYAYLDLRIREKVILRGEILLHDLSPYFENVIVTVEQLIACIYLDFIKNIKDNGNSVALQKTIVKKLQNNNS